MVHWYDKGVSELEDDLEEGHITFEEFDILMRELSEELEFNPSRHWEREQ